MRIEGRWRASSKPKELEENNDLTDLAGRWNIGIEVRITNPYIYSQGPVEVHTIKR